MNNLKRLNCKTAKVLFGIVVLTINYCSSIRCQDEWATSTPKAQQMDSLTLSTLDKHINDTLPHLQSLLIARHGKLVFEQYYHGGSKTEMHNVQSITKSITSALVGIALKKNYLKTLDQKVVDFFPEVANDTSIDMRIKKITLYHLLTMSSGIAEGKPRWDKDDNPIRTTLQQHLQSDPGTQFHYSSPAAHVFSGILFKAIKDSLYDFADKYLFQPLGIKKVIWYKDNTGLLLTCGSSLWESRDLLKIGQLYLNKGTWSGIEIIPEEYINQSVKTHISGDCYGTYVNYGYMWYCETISGYKAFYASGYGGQYLMVIPDLDMVVLCTSDWSQPEFPAHHVIVKDYIIPSMVK